MEFEIRDRISTKEVFSVMVNRRLLETEYGLLKMKSCEKCMTYP